MAARHRRSGGVQPGSGCIIWLLVMVGIALLFALNAERIGEALRKTGIIEIIGTVRSGGSPEKNGTPGFTGTPGSTGTSAKGVPEPNATQSAPRAPAAQASPAAKPSKPAEPQSGSTADPAAPGAGQPAAPPPTGAKTRPTSLFFVRIESDGVISRQEVRRAIPATDAPLSDALAALLAGPTEEEIRRGYMTLIPRGTALLGVSLRGSTATVDLSEAFMYNKYGIEGYAGQLKQVVYTSTAFPGVQDVQILIEGRARDYLGGEGVYIGKPISRNSF